MKKLLVILLCFIVIYSCKKIKKEKSEFSENSFQMVSLIDKPEVMDKNDYPSLENKEIILEGIGEEILKHSAENFYREYWVSKKKGFSTSPKALEIIKNLLDNFPDKIKVKLVSENLAIVTRPEVGISELYDINDVEDIWFLQNGKWIPFLDFQNKFYKASVLDINSDSRLDVILVGSCCDSSTYNIILGDENGRFKHTQDIVIIGEVEEHFNTDCKSKLIVKDYQNSDIQKKIQLNCLKNKFE